MVSTIALIDDDRNIITSVAMALEAEGFFVRTFTDGEAALRGLRGLSVDLVVLDIKMLRIDGIEVLKRLRKWSDLPVIFLTSKDDEVDKFLGFGYNYPSLFLFGSVDHGTIKTACNGC